METTEGLFFDVKGLLHPPDRVVAYLRYYPDNRGTRLREGVRYVKVYELARRILLLRRRWPQYLYCDKMQGRQLQGVPKRNLARLHLPQRRLATLAFSRHNDELESHAVRFAKLLAREAKLPLTAFGISGSLLVGLHRPDSDIDIIAYGADVARRIREILSSLLESGREFHKYTHSDLRRLYRRRGMQHTITFKDFESQERRKVFQGRFLQHDYFVRCVKDWREISERYGESRYAPLGTCTVSARVADDSESLLTPCLYSLDHTRVLSGSPRHRPREVVSFRGRFSEQACDGEQVVAKGRLEVVRSNGSRYFRLVVGEDPSDFLRRIRQSYSVETGRGSSSVVADNYVR